MKGFLFLLIILAVQFPGSVRGTEDKQKRKEKDIFTLQDRILKINSLGDRYQIHLESFPFPLLLKKKRSPQQDLMVYFLKQALIKEYKIGLNYSSPPFTLESLNTLHP